VKKELQKKREKELQGRSLWVLKGKRVKES